MQFARKLTVGLLHSFFICVLLDAEKLIEVVVGCRNRSNNGKKQ